MITKARKSWVIKTKKKKPLQTKRTTTKQTIQIMTISKQNAHKSKHNKRYQQTNST